MTSLALRLHKISVATSMGAVVTLRRVADESGRQMSDDQRFDVIIPASSGASDRHVEVDPGRWLIEATLPSGEVISEEVAVAKGQDLPVTLYAAEHSPREWLGWQHLVGNIEGGDTLRQFLPGQQTALKPLSTVDAHIPDRGGPDELRHIQSNAGPSGASVPEARQLPGSRRLDKPFCTEPCPPHRLFAHP